MQILCLFFFLFLFKGSSKCGFFHLAVLFRFYRVLFLHHVFLSEQIKMMMMMIWCNSAWRIVFWLTCHFIHYWNMQCSQRIYLLRLLRSQGMSSNHLNTIFHAIIVSRILYALPAWGVFMSAAQSGRIDAFLKRAHNVDFLKNSLLSMSC